MSDEFDAAAYQIWYDKQMAEQNTAKSSPFVIGDIVRLKSVSPDMTVVEVSGAIGCAFYSVITGRIEEHWIAAEALEFAAGRASDRLRIKPNAAETLGWAI